MGLSLLYRCYIWIIYHKENIVWLIKWHFRIKIVVSSIQVNWFWLWNTWFNNSSEFQFLTIHIDSNESKFQWWFKCILRHKSFHPKTNVYASDLIHMPLRSIIYLVPSTISSMVIVGYMCRLGGDCVWGGRWDHNS